MELHAEYDERVCHSPNWRHEHAARATHQNPRQAEPNLTNPEIGFVSLTHLPHLSNGNFASIVPLKRQLSFYRRLTSGTHFRKLFPTKISFRARKFSLLGQKNIEKIDFSECMPWPFHTKLSFRVRRFSFARTKNIENLIFLNSCHDLSTQKFHSAFGGFLLLGQKTSKKLIFLNACHDLSTQNFHSAFEGFLLLGQKNIKTWFFGMHAMVGTLHSKGGSKKIFLLTLSSL